MRCEHALRGEFGNGDFYVAAFALKKGGTGVGGGGVVVVKEVLAVMGGMSLGLLVWWPLLMSGREVVGL
ncbi:hypothetical protein A7P94_05610 [Eikenella sp. NML01-A-086]|nr:hypothetical protein A7P94_05610 [Eikenella sp. NML01-A-086]OAM43123.1 hypothetical protein A7Q02_01870 [Eikenella sp. NML97-A-109]